MRRRLKVLVFWSHHGLQGHPRLKGIDQATLVLTLCVRVEEVRKISENHQGLGSQRVAMVIAMQQRLSGGGTGKHHIGAAYGFQHGFERCQSEFGRVLKLTSQFIRPFDRTVEQGNLAGIFSQQVGQQQPGHLSGPQDGDLAAAEVGNLEPGQLHCRRAVWKPPSVPMLVSVRTRLPAVMACFSSRLRMRPALLCC